MLNINGVNVDNAWEYISKLKADEVKAFVAEANTNKDRLLTAEEAQKAWDNYQAKKAAVQAPVVTQVSAKPTGGSLMDQIGESYDVTLSNGVQTKCAVITLAKLDVFCKAKGIDWRKVLNENYGSYKAEQIKNGQIKSAFVEAAPNQDNKYEGCVNHDGFLVNLDLFQQVALLRAIVAKCPEYKDSVGFYNLKASISVYHKLIEAGLPNKIIFNFWTGEKFKQIDSAHYVDLPGLVNGDNLKNEDIQTYRFCLRFLLSSVMMSIGNPAFNHYYSSAMVLGGLK